MRIDKDFVKGVGYYIGDGRMKAPRSLSTVNQNEKVIKFFLKWLKEYFKFKLKDIKIKIKTSDPNYNEEKLKGEFSKKLGIGKQFIHSVSLKEKSKPHHHTIIDIWANNAKAKREFDSLISVVKEKCLENRGLAVEYVKGIMAAEGSPKYNLKSKSRSVHLKMKNEQEIKYLGKLLNEVIGIKSSILRVKNEEGMWLITISGFYEMNKLQELDIFEIESKKREKLRGITGSYKHAQVKKGDVDKFYMEKLEFFNKKLKKFLTAPELAKLIGRDRTRIINVLRSLEKKGLIIGNRKKSLGRAFEFSIKD